MGLLVWRVCGCQSQLIVLAKVSAMPSLSDGAADGSQESQAVSVQNKHSTSQQVVNIERLRNLTAFPIQIFLGGSQCAINCSRQASQSKCIAYGIWVSNYQYSHCLACHHSIHSFAFSWSLFVRWCLQGHNLSRQQKCKNAYRTAELATCNKIHRPLVADSQLD